MHLAARSPRWLAWRADIVSGLSAAVVLLALDGAYGLVAFSALGPASTALAFAAGVYASIVGNLVTPVAGARGPLLGGTPSALALLVHAAVLALLQDPRYLGADGAPRVGAIVAFVALGVTLSGVLQFVLGLLHAGRLARYVPYPVHAGFMNGVAVLMVLAMLPHLAGVAASRSLSWEDVRPASVAVALLSLAVALRAPRWTRPVPRVLVALVAGTALHHALAAWWGPAHLGQLLGSVRAPLPDLRWLDDVAALFSEGLVLGQLDTLLGLAAALAVMSTLQTLLAGTVIDDQTGVRRNGEREVVAQGAANVVSGLLGGLAVSGSLARGAVAVGAGGRGTAVRAVYALGLLAALSLAAPVLALLSMPAIAGVFVYTAWGLVDAWSRGATGRIVGGLLRGRLPRGTLLQGYGVMLLVAAIAVFASIGKAIAIGVVVGMVLFIAQHSRNPVRRIVRATQRSSRRVRTAEEAGQLRREGAAIVVIELSGPLFFGTADAAAREIEREAASAEHVIVDFARVTDIDLSGARVLLQAAGALQARGRRLLVAALATDAARFRAVREVDVQGRLAAVVSFADVDLALEDAEDRLLARLRTATDAAPRLALRDTMFGHGLDDAQLQVLEPLLVERRLVRGDTVFRRGEPGDAMFVPVQGRIGIWLRGGAGGAADRRLVSFGPGVVFGEMAMLSGEPRSADGVVEQDAVLLVLGRGAFDEIAARHPALLARLLLNLNLHLGTRLRIVTDELQAANALR